MEPQSRCGERTDRLPRPKVAAAIVTYNKKPAVLELLTLLRDLEVPTFVTENACGDGTREAIAEGFPEVSLLASEANLGGTGGFDCAVLAALSSGCEYVILLDDDVLPDPTCIDLLRGFLDRQPDYVMAAPAIYIASRPDTLQEAGGGVDLGRPAPVEAWHRFARNPVLPETLEIDYASACCLMVRTEAILRLGVMDWNYFIFSDDVDWSLRLRRAFGKAACVTQARAVHDFPWAKPFAPMRLYFFQRNNILMLARMREGEHGTIPLREAIRAPLESWFYARAVGDREVAETSKQAFLDAWRGRYGKWRRSVRFGAGRKVLDRAYFRRRRIRRVLLDITIEDFDTAALEAIRACDPDEPGRQLQVDILCDEHRIEAYRDKGLFQEVLGRPPGRRRLVTETLRDLRRRRYDLVVTDAFMAPRRPTGMAGRRAALYHNGALYEAAARPWIASLAYWLAPRLSFRLAHRMVDHFRPTPQPGLPPDEAAPLLRRIGIDPALGQPWARPWPLPFSAPPRDPVHPDPMPLRGRMDASEPAPPPATAAANRLGEGEREGGFRCWVQGREAAAPERYRPGVAPASTTDAPLFSVLVPVHNPQPEWLEECIASVRDQRLAGWQLVLVDDASDLAHVAPTLRAAAESDPRVVVDFQSPRGGISRTTNRAAALASGRYLLFLDQDDLLDPYCLVAFAQAVRDDAAPDQVAFWYADEDRFDDQRRRLHPGFKPAYSPELLLGTNYPHHPLAMERDLFDRLGGLRPAFDGSQDYDLVLRAVEVRPRAVQLPDVLYHMRLHPGSLAADAESKPEAHERGRAALAEALERRGIDAEIAAPSPGFPGYHQVRRRTAGRPSVSVLVAAADAGAAIDADAVRAAWEGCECLIDTDEGHLPARFNRLARRAGGDVLVFADAALRPDADWQSVLLPYLEQDGIGLLGGKVAYADGLLYACGLVTGTAGAVGRWHHGAPLTERGYGGWMTLTHEVSALPWQFLAVRRSLFLDNGLFDPAYRCHGFDVDLAARLGEGLGLRHLVVPACRGILADRHFQPGPEAWLASDLLRLHQRQADWLRRGDPYFNPNLSLLGEDVHMVDAAENALRAQGGLAPYDEMTVRLLGKRFPGRLAA